MTARVFRLAIVPAGAAAGITVAGRCPSVRGHIPHRDDVDQVPFMPTGALFVETPDFYRGVDLKGFLNSGPSKMELQLVPAVGEME